MRRSLLAAAAAVVTCFSTAGGASAQSVYVQTYEQYAPAPYSYYYTSPVAPAPVYREYGYRPAETFAYRPDFPPGGCGTYRYWRDGRCVDARYRPPLVTD